jgi:hypothetical protein
LLKLNNNTGYEHFEDLEDFFWTLVTDDDLGQMADNELEANEHMKLVFFKLFAHHFTKGNWKTNNAIPIQGKDHELDKHIKHFKIQRKRASDMWLMDSSSLSFWERTKRLWQARYTQKLILLMTLKTPLAVLLSTQIRLCSRPDQRCWN